MRRDDLRNPTVLVVDDDERDLQLFKAYLESLPVHVECVNDGAQAVERARRENPNVIVLDMVMPGTTGFQVCRQLKSDARTRHIQILAVTALSGIADVEEAAACGVDDFLSKPVNRQELVTRVQSLLTCE